MNAKRKSGPGVIETLSAGFDQINKMLWIVLLPIVVDVFLWKGPLLSVAPMIKKLLAAYSEALPFQMQSAQVSSPVIGDTVQSFEQMRQGLEAMADQFNLLSLLVTNVAVVPSVGISHQGDPSWVVTLTQPVAVVGLAVALELVGVFLGVVYLGLVAQQVRDGRVDVLRLSRTVWRYWLSVVGFLALVLAAAVFVGVPTGIFVGASFMISSAIGTGLMAVFAMILNIALMLALIYFFFLVDAIVISEVGPIKAARNSVKVVARNFWSTLGLIVIVFVIMAGTQVIWDYLAKDWWGVMAAILGNAYIASGLASASMLFYKTRMARLKEQESPGTNEARA